MRMPKTPPSFTKYVADNSQERLTETLTKFSDPEVVKFTRRMNQKYIHWQKMRFQKLPADLTAEEAWFAVWFSRRQQFEDVELSTDDDRDAMFKFWTPPHHFEMIHKIDQMLGGSLSLIHI